MREAHKCRTKSAVACTTCQGQRGHDREEEPRQEAPIRGEEASGKGATEGNRQVRKGNRPLRHNFMMELKDLIAVPNIADRLRPPVKFDKV